MMYQKPQRKKKRKKHKASILHCKDGTCYLCMKLKGDYRRYPVVHEHHIYDGPNRQNSEAEGLKVYLCLDHHIMGPEAVHNNHKNMRILHRDGQRAYERTHSRAEFMSLIGRNYLDEEKQEEPKTFVLVIHNLHQAENRWVYWNDQFGYSTDFCELVLPPDEDWPEYHATPLPRIEGASMRIEEMEWMLGRL